MEGQRFFDLRRWGILETTLNAYINGVGGGAEKSRRGVPADGGAGAGASRQLPDPDGAGRS